MSEYVDSEAVERFGLSRSTLEIVVLQLRDACLQFVQALEDLHDRLAYLSDGRLPIDVRLNGFKLCGDRFVVTLHTNNLPPLLPTVKG